MSEQEQVHEASEPAAASGWPPPPGWQPPPPPAKGFRAPYPEPAPIAGSPLLTQPARPAPSTAWTPPPGPVGAAHRPGAVPLRPLGLADILDAALRIIRVNPRATVGSAVLVASLAMLVPLAVTAVLSVTVDLSPESGDGSGLGSIATAASTSGLVGSVGALGFGLVLAGLGSLLVTAMVAHVSVAAAVGQRLGLAQAWTATRGRRWRLVGLTALVLAAYLVASGGYVGAWLVVVRARHSVAVDIGWGAVSVPVVLALLVWSWIRVRYLAVPALMLEPVGILGALRRAFRLTRRQFWRVFGIALLTSVLAAVTDHYLGLKALGLL